MSGTQAPPNTALDLYALVVYLHVNCNRDLLDAIADEQLSFSQMQLLERLRAGNIKPTIRQAAALLHLSCAGASRIVDTLARRGMVRREPDERDYRAKRIVITDRGEQTVVRLHAARLDSVVAFADHLDAGERKQLHKALSPLLERGPIAACRPAA